MIGSMRFNGIFTA